MRNKGADCAGAEPRALSCARKGIANRMTGGAENLKIHREAQGEIRGVCGDVYGEEWILGVSSAWMLVNGWRASGNGDWLELALSC